MSKPLTKLNKQTIKERMAHIQENINTNDSHLKYYENKLNSPEYNDNDKDRKYVLTLYNTTLSKLDINKQEMNELRNLLMQVKMYKLKKRATIKCSLCNCDSKGVKIPESGTTMCYNCIYATVLEHQTKDDWVKNNTSLSKGEGPSDKRSESSQCQDVIKPAS